MNFSDLIKVVSESGMGVASFVALLYFGNKLLSWLEDVRGNHLIHIQTAVERLADNSGETNETLKDHAKSLDVQSQMLGIIVEQTKQK